MGGGGAMRAAAKVAGYGVNGGLQGAPSLPLGQSVTSVGRKSSRLHAGIVSPPVIEDGKSVALLSSQNGKVDIPASVQKPSWEIDDWEFAGEEELLLDSINPMPRVVFGGVPTLKEAKEATSELKDALDKVYFSSNAGSESSSAVNEDTTLSTSSNSGFSETRACVTSETSVIPSVPQNAFLAFSMLKESTEAQDVVASLASDKNVWNAVLQNEKVAEFLHSQKTGGHFLEMDGDSKESFAGNGVQNTEVISSMKDSESSGNVFMQLLENVKLTVTDMVSSIAGWFHDIFGGQEAEKGSVDKATVAASFMALAVLTIMVVVVKRG